MKLPPLTTVHRLGAATLDPESALLRLSKKGWTIPFSSAGARGSRDGWAILGDSEGRRLAVEVRLPPSDSRPSS